MKQFGVKIIYNQDYQDRQTFSFESLSFSLSVQEAEKERRKKRKKEKNLVVSGGDDAFSESFDDRPKIIAPKPSVGRNESISSKV